MTSEERNHLELPKQKVTYGDLNSNGSIPNGKPNGAIPHSNPFDLDSPLKIPYSQQRQSSQWTFSLTQLIRKRNQFQRLIDKDGTCNIIHTHLKYRRFRLISDAYTTLIDLKWSYILLIFTLSYGLSWFIFAILWYVIAWVHGDLGEGSFFDMLYGGQEGSEVDYVGNVPGVDSFGNITSALTADYGTTSYDTSGSYNGCNFEDMFGDEPCVYNVNNFFGAFLFSVETQTTIGFGFRFVSEACTYAAALEAIQSIFSYLLNTILLGLIFAKIGSPSNRVATLKFSRHAVIAMRNGKLCFMFRVGNIRESHLYEAHVRVYAMKPTLTTEGEFIPLHHQNMDLSFSTGEDRTFLIWPVIICHVIDEKSPLYELSAEELQEANLEIIILLEGVVQQTGLVTQARTSYIPSEIKWGHRFSSSVIRLDSEKDKQYKIDYKKFNSTYEVPDTPEGSAKRIYREMKKKEKSRQKKKFKHPGSLEKIPENPQDKKPPPPDEDPVTWNPNHFPQQPQVTVEEPSPPSPPPLNNDPRPVDGLILHSLQELSTKIQNLENSLDKKTERKDSSPSVLNPSPRSSSAPKRRSWDPKRISLELKKRSYQGSGPSTSSSEVSPASGDESCLVPPDPDDELHLKDENCIVS